LEHIDSIQSPTNSDLNPMVVFLLNHRFECWQGHPEAGRMVRAALRLRGRSLLATSGSIRADLLKDSLDSWMTIQLGRCLNN